MQTDLIPVIMKSEGCEHVQLVLATLPVDGLAEDELAVAWTVVQTAN